MPLKIKKPLNEFLGEVGENNSKLLHGLALFLEVILQVSSLIVFHQKRMTHIP